MRSKKTHLLLLLLAVCLWSISFAQNKEVKGRIIDSTGDGIPNVSISIKGKKSISISDVQGFFKVSVPQGSSLSFDAVGFFTKDIVISDQDTLEVRLFRNATELSEVVVTALGVKRDKRNLTYSTQEVKSDELLRAQEPNVLNALTGKVAGVQINSSTGAPGSSSSIIIRGITSLTGNNQALIVLDGVPINNDETDGGGDGGAGTNRLADIDPGIIDNINVLKGAAATALYGSQGARGVVLITTKNGNRNRKPLITLSSGLSYENAVLPPRQLTYAQGSNGVYVDGEAAKTSTSWGPRIDTLYVNGQKVQFHNPLKEYFKTGYTNNNTVSVSGGNKSSDYFASFSNLYQTGTAPNTNLNRNSLFTKFHNQITDNLSLTAELTYNYSKSNRTNEGYGLQNPLMTLYGAPISYNMKPYLDSNGNQRLYRYSRNNPYWVLDNVLNTSTVNRFLPVINLAYNPASWLSITERLGADIYSDKFNYHVNIGDVTYSTGRLIVSNTNFRQFNHDLIIQLHHDWGKINTTLLLGNNIYSQHYDGLSEYGYTLAKPGYYNIASASTVTSSENSSLYRKVGFYAQTEIDYNRLLILSLSGRYDGSSVLSTSNQFYPYGSAALGFVFSDLMKGVSKDVFNYGKVRVSYAMVGNDNVGVYANSTPYYQATTSNGFTFPYNGQNGFLISSSLGNPDLKNELQKEFEVGLETKFLRNRFGLEASYFVRNMTNGLVQNVALPNSTGYSSTTINSSHIRTKGLEVLLNATPVQTKNFHWDVAISYTKLSTKVLEIAPGLSQTNIGFTYAVVGQPYGMLYGTKFARTESGQLLLDDAGLPYAADAQDYLGTASPDWLGSITNTLTYKQLSLSFYFDTKQGGVLENVDNYYNYYYGTAKATEAREDRIISGISQSTGTENKVSTTAEAYYERISSITEALIEPASYIKLRNISLGYTINKASIRKLPFQSITLTLTGRNLWIHKDKGFSGSDPESTSTYGTSNGSIGVYTFGTPTSRSLGASIKLTF